MDWNKVFKIGRNKISLKDLYFTIPSKYEKRSLFVDQKEKGIYVFMFIPKSITFSGNNIIVNGIVNEKAFRVIHSKRMTFLFVVNKPIKLQGVVQDRSSFYPNSYDLRLGIVPIYSNLSHLATNVIQENLIDDLVLRNLFLKIHTPKSYEDVINGLEGLYVIEVATIIYVLKSQSFNRTPLAIHEVQCTLTPNEYQQTVLNNIYKKLQQNKTMKCMLYGDVGAGKTLIGFFTTMQFVQNGYSVAFLVPTSVLAHQVYEVFSQWTDDVELITGKTTKKAYSKKILIGTHALLFRELPNIGLLIIDELHKWGVEQRNYLFHKNKCDVLMMTATPIPRTFQMITKGLIDVEFLNKKESKNNLIINNNKQEVLNLVLNQAKNSIIIWIINDIEKAEEFANELRSLINDVYIVHSEIKNKNEILNSITNGILVSTTVVEVGIDLNINTIVIENANRFGVSQLHQLCGRVGRRGTPGTAIFLDKPSQKLTDFTKTTTGWERSELDYKNRGGGTLHSILQSGHTSCFFAYTLNDKADIVTQEINGNILTKAQSVTIKEEYIELFSIKNSL